ncbi:2OG-Fe(II) oxygenase [Owenweeksia hongkongensis]|uniref:2OG-Fe(II) oxygenase n=1 Tax=Owenweeksia hongkongensis TaxID=253245 RepID=UPI003A923D24
MTYNGSVIWSDSSIDQIADSLAESDFCVIEDFLPAEDVKRLKAVMNHHREQEAFQKAGIGQLQNFQVDRDIRGDRIKWIDKEEALSPTKMFLEKIESFMRELNRCLFLSLKDYETHFAIYPKGTFYEAHIDQFQSSGARKISFAFYLNENWKAGDGGELRIHNDSGHLDIEPLAGRIAIFRSDTVLHEVMSTEVDRYSITGWMLDRPVGVTFV